MNTCIHEYLHAYIHTYIHLHTCTYIYIHVHTYTYIYIHIYIHTYLLTYLHTYIHVCGRVGLHRDPTIYDSDSSVWLKLHSTKPSAFGGIYDNFMCRPTTVQGARSECIDTESGSQKAKP